MWRLILNRPRRSRVRPSCESLGAKWSLRNFGSKPEVSSEVVIQMPGSTYRPPLKLSFGKLARFADGSCVASLGSTSVLVTAVCRQNAPSSSQGFLPLTVDYRQKSAAAGRIPTNFLRREMGPSEKEILTSRVIDRSVRPLFPKGFSSETQLVCNLLAVDGVNDADVVALNAASASIAMSDIPWDGPVGAVRVGKDPKSTNLIINPTRKELLNSQLNLIVTGTAEKLTVMLEGEAANLDKYLFLDGIEQGLVCCAKIAAQIESESKRRQILKRPVIGSNLSQEKLDCIARDLELMSEQKIRSIYSDTSHDKISRDKAAFSVRDIAFLTLKEAYPGIDGSYFSEAFNKMCRKIVAQMILDEGRRVDGRKLDQLRDISCEVDLHSPLHGSALFQRGQTQVFCTVALDSLESALKSDTVSILMGGVKERNFFLHYEFPAYAVNEIGRGGSVGRRELGHGALAEKALRAIVPKDFPFTIRLTSEVLESNGSSSMASVCGGTLALLDAGVPIASPAAGVAVGLVSRPAKDSSLDYAVLLDILGLEDHLGDMDFKVAGTRSGITALQADVKIPGLDFQIVKDAMETGSFGINKILDIMESCQAEPKTGKLNWPVSEKLTVPIAKRAKFMGPGGHNIKRLMAETGVQVTPVPDDVGAWTIFAPNSDALTEAKEMIDKILTEQRVPEFEFGAIYSATITEVVDRGVFVQLHPEMSPTLIPNSQLDAKKISHPSALGLKVGQELMVKFYGRDPVSGSVRLSRKVLTIGVASAVKTLKKSARR